MISLKQQIHSHSVHVAIQETLSRDTVLLDLTDSIFQKFKNYIEDIPLTALPFNQDEIEFVNGVIDKFKLDLDLVPRNHEDREETTLHPKIQKFLDEFSRFDPKQKAVLTQNLSNTKYKNHPIYYFLPSFLLSRSYPELKEYINYRDPSVERILTPKGICHAMDLRASEGKLSSNVERIACENVDVLKVELQKLSENLDKIQKLFLVQMDQTESMRGDHTIPIFIHRQSQKNPEDIIITDSAGTSQKFLDMMARFVHTLLPKADIRGVALARQANFHSCFQFALNDAQFICENPQEFLSFVKSQEPNQLPNAPYKTFGELPPKMMKLSQTTYCLKKILSEPQFHDLAEHINRKRFLILSEDQGSDSNPSSGIQEWIQKGCLITDRQLNRSTNVYANHLFAKIERQILEKIFSH